VSQLKLFQAQLSSSSDGALKWLPHHQLLTSLSFYLEEGLAKRDLLAIAIRSLPHLHELHLRISGALAPAADVPPITITSLSLRILELSLGRKQCSIIFDVPSLTHLDLSWAQPLSFKEVMDLFINCKTVTHLLLHDYIAPSVVIPWHLFSSNMISLKLLDSAQLSIHQCIQMLGCPQFSTLEIFHYVTDAKWSHLLFDAMLHQWKYLKELKGSCKVITVPPGNATTQLMAFIPIDSASLITTDDKKRSSSSTSSSWSQYSLSSPAGKDKRRVHHSLEKLTIGEHHYLQNWEMPSLRHLISYPWKSDKCDVILSFLSQSYEQIHTLELVGLALAENERAQLKRITFPNLERLIISAGSLKWLYESINAGPYLSFIQINDLTVDICEKLTVSKKPITNLIISPLTHPSTWYHYQPIHLYLLNPSNLSKEHYHSLLSRFVNVHSLQIHNNESVNVDRRDIEEIIQSFLPTRSIHLLFASKPIFSERDILDIITHYYNTEHNLTNVSINSQLVNCSETITNI
jgi:hypothetical protein